MRMAGGLEAVAHRVDRLLVDHAADMATARAGGDDGSARDDALKRRNASIREVLGMKPASTLLDGRMTSSDRLAVVQGTQRSIGEVEPDDHKFRPGISGSTWDRSC
jgi:hypothetical protein